MLYHYYSLRFPFDRLNIQGALHHPDEFVNDRDLKDTTIQAKVPFLSVLDVLSIPPFFLSLFFTYRIFSFGLLCIISFDDLLSFPNALGRGRKRISISYSSVLLLPPFVVLVVVVFCGGFIYSRYGRKSGTVGSLSESIPIQSNAVDCYGVLAMSLSCFQTPQSHTQ